MQNPGQAEFVHTNSLLVKIIPRALTPVGSDFIWVCPQTSRRRRGYLEGSVSLMSPLAFGSFAAAFPQPALPFGIHSFIPFGSADVGPQQSFQPAKFFIREGVFIAHGCVLRDSKKWPETSRPLPALFPEGDTCP